MSATCSSHMHAGASPAGSASSGAPVSTLRCCGTYERSPAIPVSTRPGSPHALAAWSDADVKAPPLKGVQALIWAEGYADGSLQGHVYPEAPESLDRWRRAGIARYIYSSGTRAAQHNWFAHSNLGDLTTLLDGHFDLDDAGGKRDPESYGTIAHTISVAPETIVFLSDVREELDAAVLAGWHAVGVRRPGDPRGATVGGRHPTVCSLDAVHLRAVDRPNDSTTTVAS